MARKFLYIVAFLIVLFIGARLALQFYPLALTRLAFEPKIAFVAPKPLEAGAYANPAMWISRPGLDAKDPAHWAPEGAPQVAPPVPALVFFVHPTSYFGRAHWNAPLDDAEADKRAALFVRGLASPFAGATQLWAPRYRQAALGALLARTPAGPKALDAAYADIAQAFDAFIAKVPQSQPIVLVGHSQGAYLLRRLIHDKIAGTPLARRVAAAYLIGWPISLEHDLPAMGLPACSAPDQAGCVVSWLSFAEPSDPETMLEPYSNYLGLDGKSLKGSAFLCSNPLTGSTGGSAPAQDNLGTMVPDTMLTTGRLVPHAVGADCRPDGTLSIGAPYDMGPYVLPGNNYHVYDIPLFWMNLRADFTRRVAAWKP